MNRNIIVERIFSVERLVCLMDRLKDETPTLNKEKRISYAKKWIEKGEVWIASFNGKDVGYAAYYYDAKEHLGYFSVLAVDLSLGLLGSRVMYEIIRIIFESNENKDYSTVRFEGIKKNIRARNVHENFGGHCVFENEEKYVMEISHDDLKLRMDRIKNLH